jgi:hypothetical protein
MVVETTCASDHTEYSLGALLDNQKGKKSAEDARKKALSSGRAAFSFQIRTLTDGFNAGRTYYLHSNSADECLEVVEILRKFVEIARKRAEKYSKFREGRKWLRSIYDSSIFQLCSSFLIVLVPVTTTIILSVCINLIASLYRRTLLSASSELKSLILETTPSGC